MWEKSFIANEGLGVLWKSVALMQFCDASFVLVDNWDNGSAGKDYCRCTSSSSTGQLITTIYTAERPPPVDVFGPLTEAQPGERAYVLYCTSAKYEVGLANVGATGRDPGHLSASREPQRIAFRHPAGTVVTSIQSHPSRTFQLHRYSVGRPPMGCRQLCGTKTALQIGRWTVGGRTY